MKISILLSFAVSICIFSNEGQAAIPGPSVDLNTCLAQAQMENQKHRCFALDDCYKNQSANREDLTECLFNAEEAYRLKEGGAAGAVPAGLYQPSSVPAAGGGFTSKVVTEIPDSNYSIKGGDHKGWDNSTQGP